ncbi:MAG: 3'-5' exonuclease [Akkermansia sp.]
MGEVREMMQGRLADLSFAAIDFESAGAAVGETDNPVQIGIVRVEELFGEEEHYCHYLACSQPIHWRAAKVHGITSAQLADAKPLRQHWSEVRRLLGKSIVVGHNLGTERKFLSSFPNHGFGPWLDTLKLARKVLPDASDYSLGSLCEALGLTGEIQTLSPNKRWHDAHFDAVASLCLLRYIVKGLQMEQAPLRDLSFALQVD